MTRITPLAIALLLLAGCATQGDPKLADCDGKHRRPANPYGSVLPNVPAAASGAAPTSAKPPTREQAPTPGPQSWLGPSSLQPRGDGA